MNNGTLAKGIEIVGILFAAFGGFLAGIAPPEAADARFAVGLSSFLALIVLFTIAALAKQGVRRAWIITAVVSFIVAVGSGFYYWSKSATLTFEYPPGNIKAEFIAGTALTAEATEYKQMNPGISNSQLMAKFGGLENKFKVWPEQSIRAARTHLITSYVVLVLAIATAIFALTEGALANQGNEK